MGIAETIMEKYQVRKTRKQKTAFIDMMQREFPGMCIEKGGMMGSRNLIFGDMESADVIFTAHYDTVIENLLPNLIIPGMPWLRKLYMLVVIAPMVLIMLLVGFVMDKLGAGEQLCMAVMLAVYFAMFSVMFFIGRPNPHTANDNTSGVIALMEIMQRLSEDELRRAAFVLFDNEEYGCVGSGVFYKAHKEMMQEKLVFNLDCVGDGDNLLLVLTSKAEERYGKALKAAFTDDGVYRVEFGDAKKIKYSSDQKHFPVSIAMAALHRRKYIGLCVGRIHTRRDTVCDMRNIEYISGCAHEFIKRI